MSSETPVASAGVFPMTHWSTIIIPIVDENSPLHRQALNDFCETYRDPVYFFIRGQGKQRADAEDLTQEFFAWVIEKKKLAGLTREGGRFRSYLLTVLQNFLNNEYRKQKAVKRGGGATIIHIDADMETRYLKELTDHTPPETLFDKEWARAVAATAFRQLKRENKYAKKENQFEQLQSYLTADPEEASYAEMAQLLSMTEDAVK